MYCCRKVLLVGTTLLTVLVLWRLLSHKEDSCNLGESVAYLNKLCYNYTTKKLTGNLCQPLCTMQIQITKCITQKNIPHELVAIWKGKEIILRAGKILSSYEQYMPHRTKFNLTSSSFIQYMNKGINNILSLESPPISWQVASEISRECDVNNDKIFTYEEAKICWQLGTNREYLLLKILKGNDAMLQLYGSCGNLYGVQYTSSEPMLASPSFSWQLRSEIVSAMLNMVEALEHTPLGSLYLCDIGRGNIGVIEQSDGKIVTKPISLKLALFEKNLAEYLRGKAAQGQPCRSHSQCSLKHCLSQCNRKLGICTGRLTSSNLLTSCRNIIMPADGWTKNLLENPPSNFKDKFDKLMRKCLQLGNSHVDKKLMYLFQQILKLSNRK